MAKKQKESKLIVYPEVELTIDDIKEHFKMDLEKFDEIAATVNAEEINTEEVTSSEELLDLAATEDLTDEQKKEIFIEQLKESKINFRNVVHEGKVTTSKFGADYRKARQTKNKAQRRARKASR